MMRLIGWKWKRGDMWSGPLLIGRGLNQVEKGGKVLEGNKILFSFESTSFQSEKTNSVVMMA